MNEQHLSRLADRVDELEMKAAFSEQLIQDLNQELILHGERIAALEKQLQRVVQNLKQTREEQPGTPGDIDERPPHY